MADASRRRLIDAYSPDEMARRVLDLGVAKAGLSFTNTIALSVLAGAFIALGAAFATLAMTDTGLGLGPTRVLGGVTFSLGLILVVVAGAELFTGNNLVAMAWASRPPSFTLFVNEPKLFGDTYRRYVERQIREGLGFEGTPLKLFWRGKQQRDAERDLARQQNRSS